MSKIKYGIDLGTTNSAIAKMENGKPMIVTTGRADIIPSCVAIQNGGRVIVGERAKTIYNQEKERESREGIKPNSFIEFKREMSNPFSYSSSNLGRNITPEELSSEVLKSLKSFVTNEPINSIIITVPAKFNMAQKQATINAGKLAGFEKVVLLEEPVAACLSFNMDTKSKKSTWLVFDFGGGTFDAAIVRKDDDGMMSVIDTGGDNELGGKDLDLAIVDKLIIPYLKLNYNIDSFSGEKMDLLRFVMKRFAEEAKIELTFQQNTDLLKTYPGDIDLKDDNGKEICLNIEFNRDILYAIFESIHQRAIDLALKVLDKNNIIPDRLDAIILVGGPTLSPVFQKMIKNQICDKIDTSINPMTIVAKGAAIFASTQNAIISDPIDEHQIVLEINYESATIEEDTLINIKINRDKTKSQLPEKIKYVLQRKDGGFVTESEVFTTRTALIELQLVKGEPNFFDIQAIDDKGNNLQCIPNEITFIPISVPAATNNYYIGIEIWDKDKEIGVFKGLKGLEKNKSLKNAVGIINEIKNPKQIVPGKSNDSLEIRIFQGEDDAEGKDSFLSEHVTSIIITGDDIEKLIPANSELEVTLRFDENGSVPNCTIFFPDINWKHEVKLTDFKRNEVNAVWLRQEIKNDLMRVEKYLKENNSPSLEKCLGRLNELDQNLTNNEGNPSGRITVLDKVRENRREIENNILTNEWPTICEELKTTFYKAEGLVNDCKNGGFNSDRLNMDKVMAHLQDFRQKVEKIISQKETKMAKELISEIIDFIRSVYITTQEDGFQEKIFIEYVNDEFNEITWINPTKAKQLINQAISNIKNGGSLPQLETLCDEIRKLIDRSVKQPPIPS